MPNITVSIPVTKSGYTGQRDAFEEHTKDYKVELLEGHRVKLSAPPHHGSDFTFGMQELVEACEFLVQHLPRADRLGW